MDVLPHPNVDGLVYARSDVGGIFRLKPGERVWTNLLDWMPLTYMKAKGSDGFAIDPHVGREGVIYSAFGQYPSDQVTSSEANGLWRSEDFGDTWQKLFSVEPLKLNGKSGLFNGFGSNSGKEDRFANNCVAVDPYNPDVIYVGTRTRGLWVSYNATEAHPDFEKIESMPNGLMTSYHYGMPSGIRIVQPDPGAGFIEDARGKRARVLFVLARGNHPDQKKESALKGGIYRSVDGGGSFQLLDQGDAPYIAYAIRFGSNGKVYAAGDTGLVLLSENDSWQRITDESIGGVYGFDVESGTPDRFVVFNKKSGTLHRSSDGGVSWNELNRYDVDLGTNSWMNYKNSKYWFTKPTGARFDPHHAGRLWTAEPFGPFRFEDFWAERPTYNPIVDGFELTVISSVFIAEEDPETEVYATMADIGAVRITDLEKQPKAHLRGDSKVNYLHSSPQILSVAGRPETLLWIQSTGGGWANPLQDGKPKIWVSENRGETWYPVDAPRMNPASESKNNSAGPARIVLSPTDPNHAVFVGSHRKPQVTFNLFAPDGKVDWIEASGVPFDELSSKDIFTSGDTLLLADPVHDGKFYFLAGRPRNTNLYVTEDGGLTWTVPTEKPWADHGFEYQTRMQILAIDSESDGETSEVWIGSGNQGLWRSSDGGKTFDRVAQNIKHVEGFCFGASTPGKFTPTLYVLGVASIDGETHQGLFMSFDLGETLYLVTPSGKPMFEQKGISDIVASKSVFGEVFIGTSGFGVAHVKIKPKTRPSLQ